MKLRMKLRIRTINCNRKEYYLNNVFVSVLIDIFYIQSQRKCLPLDFEMNHMLLALIKYFRDMFRYFMHRSLSDFPGWSCSVSLASLFYQRFIQISKTRSPSQKSRRWTKNQSLGREKTSNGILIKCYNMP